MIPSKPDKPSRYVGQKGCDFTRTSRDTIMIWRTIGCHSCGTPMAQARYTSLCRNDKEPIMAGLHHHYGKVPAEGQRVWPHGPSLCPECRTKWLEARALERPGNGEVIRG